MKRNIRGLSEGGLSCAIYIIFLIFDQVSGGIGGLFLFSFIPIPLAILTYRQGFLSGFICYFVMMIAGLLLSPISGLYYSLSALIVALIIGYGLKIKMKPLNILLLSALIYFIANIISIYFLSTLLGFSIEEDIYFISIILKLFITTTDENLYFIAKYTLISLYIITSILEAVTAYFATAIVIWRILKKKIFNFQLYFKINFSFALLTSILLIIIFTTIFFTFETNLTYSVIGINIFIILNFIYYLYLIGQLRKYLLVKNKTLFIVLSVVFSIFILFASLLSFAIIISDLGKKLLYNILKKRN